VSGLVEWVRRRVREAGAKSESATDRDGAFSYKSETHAAALGFGAGLVSALLVLFKMPEASPLPAVAVVAWALGIRKVPKSADPHVRDIAREPAYAVGAVALGFVVTFGASTVSGVVV